MTDHNIGVDISKSHLAYQSKFEIVYNRENTAYTHYIQQATLISAEIMSNNGWWTRLPMAMEMSSVCVSFRAVRFMAGYSALSTTQRYIESDGLVQRRVVEMM